jgi:hypothetical protein
MPRTVHGLIAKQWLARVEYGSQGHASKYILLDPGSRGVLRPPGVVVSFRGVWAAQGLRGTKNR